MGDTEGPDSEREAWRQAGVEDGTDEIADFDYEPNKPKERPLPTFLEKAYLAEKEQENSDSDVEEEDPAGK
eukprot:2942096-Pyramimonas_sp.AAC.1